MFPEDPMDGTSWKDRDAPSEVHLTRIDVPFVELTAFFVKASFAFGLAFLLTSWLWVIVGTGVVALGAGLLALAGVPAWLAPPPAPVAVVAPLPPPPPPLPLPPPPPEAAVVAVAEPLPPVEPPPQPASVVDPNRAATEAAQLAEIERMRRERAQRGDR